MTAVLFDTGTSQPPLVHYTPPELVCLLFTSNCPYSQPTCPTLLLYNSINCSILAPGRRGVARQERESVCVRVCVLQGMWVPPVR